jgi:hypothetical protein
MFKNVRSFYFLQHYNKKMEQLKNLQKDPMHIVMLIWFLVVIYLTFTNGDLFFVLTWFVALLTLFGIRFMGKNQNKKQIKGIIGLSILVILMIAAISFFMMGLRDDDLYKYFELNFMMLCLFVSIFLFALILLTILITSLTERRFAISNNAKNLSKILTILVLIFAILFIPIMFDDWHCDSNFISEISSAIEKAKSGGTIITGEICMAHDQHYTSEIIEKVKDLRSIDLICKDGMCPSGTQINRSSIENIRSCQSLFKAEVNCSQRYGKYDCDVLLLCPGEEDCYEITYNRNAYKCRELFCTDDEDCTGPGAEPCDNLGPDFKGKVMCEGARTILIISAK